MIVDASAVLAILLDEPEADAFKRHLTSTPGPHPISAVNYVEAAIRLERHAPKKADQLDPLLDALDLRVVAVSEPQARLARQAYRAFGKGFHEAKLNMGDCFAYALARSQKEPLLFKGDDFRQTDIEAAI